MVLLVRARLLSSRAFQGGSEMAFRAICVALLLSSLPIAGCGTVANLVGSRPEEGGKSPFGGVRQDVCCIKKAANGESGSRTHPESESGQHPPAAPMLFSATDLSFSPEGMAELVARMAPMLFSAADLPFSLVGDVVTWPYTAAYSWINQPVPTPSVIQATAAAPPLTPFAPENKEPEKKTPEKDTAKGKQRDDKPAQLSLPLPDSRGN